MPIKELENEKIYINVPYPKLIESINIAHNGVIDYSSLYLRKDVANNDFVFELPIVKGFALYEIFINYSSPSKSEFENLNIGFLHNNGASDNFKLNLTQKFQSFWFILKFSIDSSFEKFFFHLNKFFDKLIFNIS